MTDNKKVLEFCPLCAQNRKISKVRFYQLNLDEAVFMCEETKCNFLFHKDYEDIYIQRRVADIDKPEATPTIYEEDIQKKGFRPIQSSFTPSALPGEHISSTQPAVQIQKRSKKEPQSGAHLAAEEEIARFLGDINLEEIQVSDTEELPSEEVSLKPLQNNYQGFLFSSSPPEITLGRLRRKRYKGIFRANKRGNKRKQPYTKVSKVSDAGDHNTPGEYRCDAIKNINKEGSSGGDESAIDCQSISNLNCVQNTNVLRLNSDCLRAAVVEMSSSQNTPRDLPENPSSSSNAVLCSETYQQPPEMVLSDKAVNELNADEELEDFLTGLTADKSKGLDICLSGQEMSDIDNFISSLETLIKQDIEV